MVKFFLAIIFGLGLGAVFAVVATAFHEVNFRFIRGELYTCINPRMCILYERYNGYEYIWTAASNRDNKFQAVLVPFNGHIILYKK